MTMKQNIFILAAGLMLCSAVQAGESSVVKIYLPANVKPQVAILDIGNIAIITCDDEKELAKVQAVQMGRAPWTKEKMVIERMTILARLATCGIKADRVQFSGAEKVTVERDERIITSDQLLKACEKFLQDNRPGPADCTWKVAHAIKDLSVPSAKDLKVQPALAKDSPDGQIKLEIIVTSGTTTLGKTDAFFKILYPAKQAVATKDIAVGEAVSQANTRIDIVPQEIKPADGWAPPYGMKATVAIKEGTILKPGVIQPPKPEVLVKARQIVTMRMVIGDGFVLSALGEAQENGCAGDIIKVKNSDSKQIVIAKVAFDGSVEPLGGSK